jgi:hypothetical protein
MSADGGYAPGMTTTTRSMSKTGMPEHCPGLLTAAG